MGLAGSRAVGSTTPARQLELAHVSHSFAWRGRSEGSFRLRGRGRPTRDSLLGSTPTSACGTRRPMPSSRRLRVIVPRDAVEAISEEDQEAGLKCLEGIYKADLPYAKEIFE